MITDTSSYRELVRPVSFPEKRSGNDDVLCMYDLSIGYKIKGHTTPVADKLNLNLRKGEFVCLLGPNGAGKSTLIRTLAGIQKPLAGEVHIEGENLAQVSRTDLSKKLSLVLTESISAGNLNVYTVLTLGRYPYLGLLGILTKKDKEIIREAVIATGIEKFLNKQLHELSDGERQKVMIARALVQDTPVIILDEPTAHLDLPNRVEVMRLLKRLVRNTRKAVLLSTHELDLALQAADRIWLMLPDQSLAAGTPEDLILNGTFENAFNRNGFDFRKETGTFRVTFPEAYKKVWLTGEGLNYFWMKRALERDGYHLVPDSEHIISANEHEGSWMIVNRTESRVYTTVEAVLEYLRQGTAPADKLINKINR